ncbi:MAG: hypothetical protein ABI763_14050, partial [Bacteroidota bacterium]
MKTRLNYILILFMSLVGFQSAKACHEAGFDISYTHLNGPNYRIHCSFYRDCSGAMLGNLTLNVSSVTCGYSNTYLMMPVANTGHEVTHACNGYTTICNGGSQMGMELWEYEVDVVMGQCPDWSFSIVDCCRNGVITTLQNPSTDLVVEARLDNSLTDNSSPQFTNDPFFIAYPNQDFHFNNGAIDPDGDSLVYVLVTPRSAPNSQMVYNPPLTLQQPLISSPAVSFDATTGDIFIHPDTTQVGIIVYEIQEYRNGLMIGSTTRDVILFVMSYSNQSPGMTGINGGSQHTISAFPGYEICFDI